jgi:DNA ligase-1
MDAGQRFVWNKLITGAFRVGVSQGLVIRALAKVGETDAATVAHRLMGDWEPTPESFARLLSDDGKDADASRPYPFFLAHPIDGDPASLGSVDDWQAEWKWDGIRAQLIRRSGRTFLWSRGEELVTDRYPEIAEVGPYLPEGTVIDGEILPWKGARSSRSRSSSGGSAARRLSKAILAEVPVALMAMTCSKRAGSTSGRSRSGSVGPGSRRR